MLNANEKMEQTSNSRFKARIAIFHGADQRILMSNYSVNLSTGGVFIETANVLPVDATVMVKFKLPSSDAVITCQARVAWINGADRLRTSSLPSGMGLQFIDLSLKNMNRIRGYLHTGEFLPIW